jgi:uncharacterized protein YutD
MIRVFDENEQTIKLWLATLQDFLNAYCGHCNDYFVSEHTLAVKYKFRKISMGISASIFRLLQLILSCSCDSAFLLKVSKFLPAYAALFLRHYNIHRLLSVYQKESKQRGDQRTNLFIITEFGQRELRLKGHSANVDGGNAKLLPENRNCKGSLKQLNTDGRYLSGSGRGQILGDISFLKPSSFSLCPQTWQKWSAANKKFELRILTIKRQFMRNLLVKCSI